MPKPPISIKVTTADTELQFAVAKQSSTQALFDQVITTTGIREVRNCLKFTLFLKKNIFPQFPADFLLSIS